MELGFSVRVTFRNGVRIRVRIRVRVRVTIGVRARVRARFRFRFRFTVRLCGLCNPVKLAFRSGQLSLGPGQLILQGWNLWQGGRNTNPNPNLKPNPDSKPTLNPNPIHNPNPYPAGLGQRQREVQWHDHNCSAAGWITDECA